MSDPVAPANMQMSMQTMSAQLRETREALLRATKAAETAEAERKKEREALEREREEMLRKEREGAQAEREAIEREFRVAQEHLEKVKAEKRQQYGEVLERDVRPFLKELAVEGGSAEVFERELNEGLEDAFMDEARKASLNVAVAASREVSRYRTELQQAQEAAQVKSSDFEKIFQENKAWEAKIKEIEELAAKEASELKGSVDEKEALIATLRKELEELAAKRAADVNNPESHFDGAPAAPELPAEQPVAVAATASAAPAEGKGVFSDDPLEARRSAAKKISPLFDFQPDYNWRSYAT